MFNKNIIYIIALVSLLIASETFNLRDGSSIIGERISEDESSIIIKTSYGEITINKSDLVIKEYRVELRTGEVLIGIKVEENDLIFILETQGFGNVEIMKTDILSIQELNGMNNYTLPSKSEYIAPESQRGIGVFGIGTGIVDNFIANDKDVDFTEGEEQLIDLFLDPSAHTLKRSTLYMSGFSFGFGLTDNIQVTTRWNNFFWGDLNLRMKYKIFSTGNWKRQSTIALGMDYHQRWSTSDKYKWASGQEVKNDKTYYWGGWIPVTSVVSKFECHENHQGDDECEHSEVRLEDTYDYMIEFFGAYTFSKARANLKGQINQTIGARATIARVGDNNTWELFPRIYYGADFDLTPKFKVLVLGIYDEFMLEPYQLDDPFGVDYLSTSESIVTKDDDVFPVHFDFGFVYALNNNFRFAIHFQKPWIGFYWKF